MRLTPADAQAQLDKIKDLKGQFHAAADRYQAVGPAGKEAKVFTDTVRAFGSDTDIVLNQLTPLVLAKIPQAGPTQQPHREALR